MDSLTKLILLGHKNGPFLGQEISKLAHGHKNGPFLGLDVS